MNGFQAHPRSKANGGNDGFRIGLEYGASRGGDAKLSTRREVEEPLPGEVPNADPHIGGMSSHEDKQHA
jgi:hypothetical protein